MKYVKPEVVVLGTAVETIQGQKGFGQVDSLHEQKPSISAYEADE